MEVLISILLLFAITLPIWSSADNSSEELQIVGGHNIEITQAPYQVSLRYEKKHFCGGTIVAKDIVLTAAHCVLRQDIKDFDIRAGSSIRFAGGRLYKLSKYVIHPDYLWVNGFDIAVLKLSKPLQFNKNVSAIPMMDKDIKIRAGEKTNVTGWGTLKYKGEFAIHLQLVQLPIVDQEECAEIYKREVDMNPTMLCAGFPEGGKGSCNGDSGGPLVYDGKLAGLVSWGADCALPHYPDVFTNISTLRPWIDETIANLTQNDNLETPLKLEAENSTEEIEIVGGHDIDISQAPYQVSVLYKFGDSDEYEHSCGGTIVAKDIILTAAQCVKNKELENFQIRVGSSIRDVGGELYQISKIYRHPNFKRAIQGYDVAVIKLSKPLQFSKDVQVIPMIDKDIEIREGEQTNVTGWGLLEEDGELATKLQMVQIPIVSQEQCNSDYDDFMEITTTMLCAGLPEGGKDSCKGDGGGPLVYDGKLAGVVSWSLGCGNPGRPGVYANVSTLRPWIDETIAKLRQMNIFEAALKLEADDSSEELQIVGGHDIEISQAPYQVSLRYKSKHNCGGTIVAKDIVVTAAHCVKDQDIKYLDIRAGSSIRFTGGQLYQISKVVVHPNYVWVAFGNDVAVLKLSKPLQFSKNVSTIPMMDKDIKIRGGELVNVTGWGRLKYKGKLAIKLQMVQVPIVDQEECAEIYKREVDMNPTMLCAGFPEGGKGFCNGDSGGPLVYDGKFAGIVSWSVKCAEPHYPQGYANVSTLRPWIDETIANLTQINMFEAALNHEVEKSSEEIQIIGGDEIDISQAPYQVSVNYKSKHICGGTIVGKDIIVTTARCVVYKEIKYFQIRAGSSIRYGGQRYKISKIVNHPNFQIDLNSYDVAVIKLSKPLQFSKNVTAIPMINKDIKIPRGEETNVTGWGMLKPFGRLALKLRMVQVPIVDQEECEKAYIREMDIDTSMLCAGLTEGGKGPCSGDEGGPMVYDGKLAGIISIPECGQSNRPGVYANVSNLRPWIDEVIANLTKKDIFEAPQQLSGRIRKVIREGHDIDIKDAPYQVSLVHKGKHDCGGTIVAKDIIVTAAHCVHDRNVSDIKIRVGSSNVKCGGKVYPVGDIILHEYYDNDTNNNDIAVLWLSTPLQFSDSVKAIPMFPKNTGIQEGQKTIVTGWGALEKDGENPVILQRVEVPIIGQRQCKNMYPLKITPSMFCAGFANGGKDSCDGDSGGPLVYDGKLAGVVSWGSAAGCGAPHYPGVYANVSYLRPWIDRTIGYLRWKHFSHTIVSGVWDSTTS